MTEAEKKRRTRSAYRILSRLIEANENKGKPINTDQSITVALNLESMVSEIAGSAKEHLQNFEYEEDER